MEENNEHKGSSFIGFLFKTLIIIIVCVGVGYYIGTNYGVNTKKEAVVENVVEEETTEVVEEEPVEEQKPVVGQVSGFDINFLKQHLEKENKIYSPLSIKYALKMLEDGSNGNTKSQISKVIGDATLKTYKTSENMALANVMFVRDTYKDSVKKEYVDLLKSTYGASIEFDDFASAKNINKWVNENTLGILDNLVDDDTVRPLDFALINALAIDLEWNNRFFPSIERGEKFVYEDFPHIVAEKIPENDEVYFFVNSEDHLKEREFKSASDTINVSGMEIHAVVDNYDLVGKIGEENIKKTLKEEYTKMARGLEYDETHVDGYYEEENGNTDADIDKFMNQVFEYYIPEIKKNYHKVATSIDFELYTDDTVKVFAKDLKTVDGVTLQYVGIMPTTLDLDTFVGGITEKDINKYIKGLKTIEYGNFEEGYVTNITGFIPKFDYEYSLDLMNDLKKLNITDVFESGKADLSNMVEGDAFIGAAVHKANIEFTEDGIKAAAATMVGGLGAGSPFDYFYEVPVKNIDLTFNKPFLFLIRDKDSGDVWFVGTVYEPLLYKEDTSPNKF